jgi:hypothetical protein
MGKKQKKTIYILKDRDYIKKQIEQSKRMMKFAILPIYVVTTMHIADRWLNEPKRFYALMNNRPVGWFFRLEDAITCVEENWNDIYECGGYNLAVIEEVWQGLYPHIEREIWFHWDRKKKKYMKIEKPKCVEGTIAFGIG